VKNKLVLLFIITLLSGCAVYGIHQYDSLFGKASIQNRKVDSDSVQGRHFSQSVQPILESRCVVCHGCYDAPCQLKLSSTQGIERGISKQLVYDGSRLLAEKPNRLFIDAKNTQDWRDRGFSPVLNERLQSPEANLAGSVLYNSLLLKQSYPLPNNHILSKEFDFSLERSQTCAPVEQFHQVQNNKPLSGMPYGLPAINHAEFKAIEHWLKTGSKMPTLDKLNIDLQQEVDKWEAFLNQDSLKHQLASRYIYEHWFLAHIYFPSRDETIFFKLVRSKTPPGQAIEQISTRRPFEDPKVARIYYRLWQDPATILAKTHLPLALNDKKITRLYKQFIAADYEVSELPDYDIESASNPFKTFKQIPVKSKYQFMLDEAQLIIMGFIKGPVCRGQVALNVINDHFWVMFVDPTLNSSLDVNQFLASQTHDLALPAQEQSNALPIFSWLKYAKSQDNYLAAKSELANKIFKQGEHLNTNLLWHGEGINDNAALTIFRHFDSATVLKGFVGQAPKTAWVIDYALFERIHYLLVAGYDVYGNVGHQLLTRLYMDFLRMEGESSFLALLPSKDREQIKTHWYRGATPSLINFLQKNHQGFEQETGIEYVTKDPQKELYQKIQKTLKPVLNTQYKMDQQQDSMALLQLENIPPAAINLLPQVSFIMVEDDDKHRGYSVLHHNAHFNITSLLNEKGQRAYKEDTISILPGFVGDYPSAIWYLEKHQLNDFVEQLQTMKIESDYYALKSQYGIRRTHADFWYYSDLLHRIAKQYKGIEFGLFDYNRLENR